MNINRITAKVLAYKEQPQFFR